MPADFLRIGSIDDDTVEVVEHKGVGHPDTLCDALAEELGRALCRHYLRTFGAILHHNVDKALIVGGSSRPAFGGGHVIDPIEIDLAGRATRTVNGVDVPLVDLAEESTLRWIEENMHALTPQHVRLTVRVRGGSGELVDMFSSGAGIPLANDTSVGVGHAPFSPVERAVLASGQRLRALITEAPEVGEDTKVLAIRDGERLELVVACAFVGQWLATAHAYTVAKERVAAEVRKAAQGEFDGDVSVVVNAGDDEERQRIFLTVTGTSAEGGDDGQVGRGNRANGLITPYRPMTIEAFAGKNPVSHVGKTYSVLAQRVATEVARRTGASRAECILVSKIGQPVDRPGLAHVRLRGPDPEEVRSVVATVLGEQLARAGSVWRDLLGWED